MDRPPPTEAIFNVYELKKQPEIVRYCHAAAGFPTKPPWLRAINNGHYMSWPGLTGAIVQKHFPESEETLKGHARKTRSGLRSTKTASPTVEDITPSGEEVIEVEETNSKRPTTKQKEIFVGTYDLQDDMQRKCIQIRQESSHRNPAEGINTSWYS